MGNPIHCYGIYNNAEEMIKCYTLNKQWEDDSTPHQITIDDIVFKGDQLGGALIPFGDVQGHTGTHRIRTTVDASGTIILGFATYDQQQGGSEVLSVGDTPLTIATNIMWYGLVGEMDVTSLTGLRVIWQQNSGEIMVSPNISAGVSFINTNFRTLHGVQGVDYPTGVKLADGHDFRFLVADVGGYRTLNITPEEYLPGQFVPDIVYKRDTEDEEGVTVVYTRSNYKPYIKQLSGFFGEKVRQPGDSLARLADASGTRFSGLADVDITRENYDHYPPGTRVTISTTLSGYVYPLLQREKYVMRAVVEDYSSVPHLSIVKSEDFKRQLGASGRGDVYGSVEKSPGLTDLLSNSSYATMGFGGGSTINAWLRIEDGTDPLYQKLTGTLGYKMSIVGQGPYGAPVASADDQTPLYPNEGLNGYGATIHKVGSFNTVMTMLFLADGENIYDIEVTPPEEGKEIEDEPIEEPENPGISAMDIGAIAIFNPSTAQMRSFTQEMQSGMIDEEHSILSEIVKYYQNSPLEGIMSCHVVPVNVSTSGEEAPHFGNVQFETEMPKVTEQYYNVNFGSIKVEKKFASFLDYSPYTKIQIYLPYIGFRDLDVDDIMGKTVGVKYNYDILTGAMVAYITVDGSTHYQFSGSAIMQFPLTASNHNNLITSLVGLVTGVATGVTGLVAGGGLGAVAVAGGVSSLVSSGVGVIADSKPQIIKGGSFAMTNGFMSVKSPYLVIDRPIVNIPEDFNIYTGKMSNKTKAVSDCKGYTEYASIDVDTIPALQEEKTEIERILKGGFYA